jgi:hypothetical protein
MLANEDDVTVLENGPVDMAIVQVGAIEAFHIFDNIILVLAVNLGVVSGDGRIVDGQKIIWLAADCDYAASDGDLPQHALLELKT